MSAAAPLNDLEPASSYDELVDLLDDVRVARGLSFEALTELSGLGIDHAQKILGPARAKPLSRMALDVLLPTLGVRLAIVPDPDAIAAMQEKWEHRDESNVRSNHWRCSQRVLDRARPFLLREIIASLATAAAVADDQSRKQRPRRETAPARPALPPLASGPALPPASLPVARPSPMSARAPKPRSEMDRRAHLQVVSAMGQHSAGGL